MGCEPVERAENGAWSGGEAGGPVVFGPAGAGAAVSRGVAAHGPGEPGLATVGRDEQHRRVADGFGGERDGSDALAGRGRQLLVVDVHLVLDDVGGRQCTVTGDRVAGGAKIETGDDRTRRVEERPVVEMAGRPVPRELPPVPHPPGVVPLTRAVDRDRLVT